MKKLNIIYWVVTGLLAAFSLLGSFLDISHAKDALALMAHLGYPVYFATFIGVARLLGIIAILIPGFPKIKEWAYAGLVFDFVGAIYSGVAAGDSFEGIAPAVFALLLVVGSYILYTIKRTKVTTVL